jgi:TolB protein
MMMKQITLATAVLLLSVTVFAAEPVEFKPSPSILSERQLTHSEEMDYLPSWSPDGKALAFTSYRGGTEEIWVMDANGEHLRQLTDHPKGDWSPAWSPDGSRIVFTSGRTGVNQLWMMNADGTDQHALTAAEPLPTVWNRDPSWSRDGRMLIFTSSRTGKDENWIMDLTTGEQWPHSIGMGEHWHPSFSPDGKAILFSSNLTGEWGLWKSDLKGKNLIRLVADQRFDNNPAASFSPDGSRIVFRTADSNLYLMNADGTGVVPLTTDGMVEGWRSSWSPDGKRVAYTSLRSGNSDIWVIELK